jgi:hypothetical protein
MKNHPRNELANRIPYNEKADSNTWIIIVKRKGGINMQNPRKKRRQNLTFLLIASPYDSASN